jgi:serine/threonine protein phosphatase PrpC
MLKSRLFINQDLQEGEVVSLEGGTAAVFTARSPDRNRNGDSNEDSAAVFPLGERTAVLAVADGCGGLRGGQQASGIAITLLRKSITDALKEDRELRYGILNGFEQANKQVIDMGIGAATTLAVLEIQGNRVRPYHVGDSTIIVTGQRGKIKNQTAAHSPVGYAVEGGFLDEKSAMFHEDRHLISNMIGSADMRIEVGPTIKLAARDTVILATDGLSDNLDTQEIVTAIRTGPIDRSMKTLCSSARDRMQNPGNGHPSKLDDMTFIVFRLKS